MAKREIVRAESAPQVGFSPGMASPISQGTRFGNLVFVSGMGPLDPETKQLTATDIEGQVRSTLDNVAAVLEAGGSSLANTLKINCYLRDMGDFPVWNTVFKEYFPGDPPARTTVQASAPREGVLVEIEAIGCIPD